MNFSVDLLVNGKVRVSDKDDDAPMLTLEFHNEFANLSDLDKLDIAAEAAAEALKRLHK
jgi:hypothetical protein